MCLMSKFWVACLFGGIFSNFANGNNQKVMYESITLGPKCVARPGTSGKLDKYRSRNASHWEAPPHSSRPPTPRTERSGVSPRTPLSRTPFQPPEFNQNPSRFQPSQAPLLLEEMTPNSPNRVPAGLTQLPSAPCSRPLGGQNLSKNRSHEGRRSS